VLISELLRTRGQELIEHPHVQIVVAEYVWEEAEHELRKRLVAMARFRGAPDEFADTVFDTAANLVARCVEQIPLAIYDGFEAQARQRIPRDPDDWHTVAIALAHDADRTAIWTNDGDFLGCGVATWTTETLLAHLAWLAEREKED